MIVLLFKKGETCSPLICRIKDSLDSFNSFSFYVGNGWWAGKFENGFLSVHGPDETFMHFDHEYRVYFPVNKEDIEKHFRGEVDEYIGELHNDYTKYNGIPVCDLFAKFDKTRENYRNLLISLIGAQRWYRILEIEDTKNIKFIKDSDFDKEIIDILSYHDKALSVYTQLMYTRCHQKDLENYYVCA